MNLIDNIKQTILENCGKCVIKKIVDYREKGIYTVYIAPVNNPNATTLDSIYSIDNKTYVLKGVFYPPNMDPRKYFNLTPDRVIYEGDLYV